MPNVGRAGGVGLARARAAPAGSGFSVATGAAAGPRPTYATAPVALTAILAQQEGSGEPAGDRDARRHGNAMLALLTELQHAVLGGPSESGAVLQRLSALAEASPRATTPALQSVIAAIGLRARVELARCRGELPCCAHRS